MVLVTLGEVVDVGSNVMRLKRGDEVFAATHPFDNGSFAEYTSVPEVKR